MTHRLDPGHSLAPSSTRALYEASRSLTSPNGRFAFILHGNGNIVLYGPGKETRWETGTAGHSFWGISRATMRFDGNFVLYGPSGECLWESGTSGHPGAILVIQNDGTAVIRDSAGDTVWSTQPS